MSSVQFVQHGKTAESWADSQALEDRIAIPIQLFIRIVVGTSLNGDSDVVDIVMWVTKSSWQSSVT